jgi:hypothetical protein
MKAALRVALVLVTIAAGASGIALLRQNRIRMEKHAADLRRRVQIEEQLRIENRQWQTLAAQVARADDVSVHSIRTELEGARQEMAELEQRALASRTQNVASAATLETNRDPMLGLTRIEHFSNVGQTTPAAGFQTLVWAAR